MSHELTKHRKYTSRTPPPPTGRPGWPDLERCGTKEGGQTSFPPPLFSKQQDYLPSAIAVNDGYMM